MLWVLSLRQYSDYQFAIHDLDARYIAPCAGDYDVSETTHRCIFYFTLEENKMQINK